MYQADDKRQQPATPMRLLRYSDLPAWMRDNDLIEAHYRPPQLTPAQCVRTAFLCLTNETVNVWSHFLASVAFLALAGALSWRCGLLGGPQLLSGELAPALRGMARGTLPLLLMASLCTGLSTALHIFWPLSPKAMGLLGQLDYVGIACLCAGHAATACFYAFYCAPHIAMRYYAAISIALLSSLRLILSKHFRAQESRVLRAVTFVCLGASIAIPAIHAAVLHRWSSDNFPVFFTWLFASGVLYLLGAALYATRVPERFRPGKHDRYASSHQLMHFAVIAGICLHTYGCRLLMAYRIRVACTLSPLV